MNVVSEVMAKYIKCPIVCAIIVNIKQGEVTTVEENANRINVIRGHCKFGVAVLIDVSVNKNDGMSRRVFV